MSLKNAAVLALAAAVHATAPRYLAPEQDIVFWPGANSENPLTWLGANGPWAKGPNVYDISTDVPDNCYIDQAAYISRHGSRYPDTGAYAQWTEMASRFSAGGYIAEGELSFLPSWRPVLSNPSRQIAMQSPTGYKEAMDMGYQLRTRYPQLYTDGNALYVWANNYTRVLQTAQNFVRGFLGPDAATLGHVVSVTSKNFVGAIGNSLAPSDQCPKFTDGNGGTQQPAWDAIWQPKVQARLQQLIRGNLTLTTSDVNLIPYLCGFESQITGRLSPFCDVFTDEELKMYQYSNDLRYYYGMGPGTGLPQTMMTPYLKALVDLLVRGPAAGNSSFVPPPLLVSFLNDGQLIETLTASGVFDAASVLSATEKDDDRLFMGSRFVTMRGTVAFERLNCRASGSASASGNQTYVRIRLNDQVYPLPFCRCGPGRSCRLDRYAKYLSDKLAKQGDWLKNCNVTTAGAPTTVAGASFYTNLAQPHLQVLSV